MRFIGAVVPDEGRTIHHCHRIIVRNLGTTTTTEEWFRSPPLDVRSLACISQIRLETASHDQGWTSDANPKEWSWFEIALLDSRGKVKGGLQRLTDDVSTVQNYDLAKADPDHAWMVFNTPDPPSRGQ
jgi:hypothetical protein